VDPIKPLEEAAFQTLWLHTSTIGMRTVTKPKFVKVLTPIVPVYEQVEETHNQPQPQLHYGIKGFQEQPAPPLPQYYGEELNHKINKLLNRE
jgi:hypothetical protein